MSPQLDPKPFALCIPVTAAFDREDRHPSHRSAEPRLGFIFAPSAQYDQREDGYPHKWAEASERVRKQVES